MELKMLMEWRKHLSVRLNSLFSHLQKFASPSEIWIGIIGSSFLINLLSLAFPIFLLQIYDRIIPRAAIHTLFFLFLGVVAALVLENILRLARASISGWMDAKFEHASSVQAFGHFLNMPFSNYEKQSVGAYFESLLAIRSLKDFYAGQVAVTLLDIPFVLLFLLLIAYFGGFLVIFPLGAFALSAWRSFRMGQQLSQDLANRQGADNRVSDYLFEMLGGLHTIKSMGMEAGILRRYERLQNTCAMSDQSLGEAASQAGLWGNLAAQATTVLVALFGAFSVMSGSISIGGLAACVLLTGRVLQPLNRALNVWARLQVVDQAQARLTQLEQLAEKNKSSTTAVKSVQGNVRVQTVSLVRGGKTILDQLSLDIAPKSLVGITGAALSGKTSLLEVLSGLVAPTSGKIFLDQYVLDTIDATTLRQYIAYLPSEGTLFRGTVLENITLFSDALESKAEAVAAQLGLLEEIRALPKGFETVVGCQVVESLSPGFVQRICIARALMMEPQIILFDSANMALDRHSDDRIKEIILSTKDRCTWVVASMRPSFLKLMDHVYELKAGHLCQTY